LRKGTFISIVSVRMEQLFSHWTDFDEIRYLGFYRKSVEKFQVFIKIWQTQLVLYIKTFLHFLKIYFWIILKVRNVSDKCCRVNQNRHFRFSNFFRKSFLYATMWKNMVQPDRPL
jgi:hypothetical protein